MTEWKKIEREVDGKTVVAFECRNMRLRDEVVLLVLQGLSAVAAVGPVFIKQGEEEIACIPIIVEGFNAYDVPVHFRRVVVGVPEEESVPLELLVAAFA